MLQSNTEGTKQGLEFNFKANVKQVKANMLAGFLLRSERPTLCHAVPNNTGLFLGGGDGCTVYFWKV